MKKEQQKNKNLLKHNIIFSIITILINAIFYNLIPQASKNFFEYGLLINSFLLYIYYSNLFSTMRKKIIGIKTETAYTNFPLRILVLFLCFICTLFFNIFTLYKINPEAINIIYISNLFINTITIHIPLIILFVFIYLITPAIIIPNYENTKYKKANKVLNIFLLIIIIFFSWEIYKSIKTVNEEENNTKYNLEKITYEYNDKFLKYKDISKIAIEELKKEKATFPFSYTTKERIAFSYNEASNFCNSMNAEVGSISEIYNALFHQFKLKGDKYYWTRNTAGRNSLLLHFKDLNYEVIKPQKNMKADVICTTATNSKYLFLDKKRFEEFSKLETNVDKFETDIESTETNITKQEINDNSVNIPMRFLSFDIKFVSENYFNEMIKQGYTYDRNIKINPINQVKNLANIQKIKSKTSEIKLCHFPFIDYKDFSISQEKEIWKQNFCSPAFEIIDIQQEEKTQYEKDAYCISHGGRLPNIAELSGIIKSSKIINPTKKYWVQNTIHSTGEKKHIFIDNLQKQILSANIAQNKDLATVICIKESKNKSNIIANFTSKFINTEGKHFAERKCPKCDYYELPDMVLDQ